MTWNINYPDYGMGFGGAAPAPQKPPESNYLSGMATGGASGAAAGSAAGPWGALIGAGVGAGASAYGTFLQSQQAEADYQRAMLAWREEESRQRQREAQARQQQTLQNNLAGGNYARSLSADIQAPYIGYARAIGL